MHHRRWALVLSIGAGLWLIPIVWGLFMLEPFAAFLGAALSILTKLWFCDRMVWLYEDMKDSSPVYRSWQHYSGIT